MSSTQSQPDPGEAPARRGRPRVEGAKRTEILAAATERFGRNGYEDTKWADIAADVGVGPTALYHYFESKQHCLYVIMDQAIEGFRSRFELLSNDGADPLVALVSVMEDCFELSEHDVQRNRVLVAEQGLLSRRSGSPREEEARQAARARTRDLEFVWASFLSHAMQGGTIPKSDPRLLTRDPHSSLELVADDVEFTIQWADDSDRASRQFVGGLEELRAFIDAGDMREWAHHVLFAGTAGQVEFALGETRYDSGERIGTFLAVAQLDADGRMARYMVARSPAIAFESGLRIDAGAD